MEPGDAHKTVFVTRKGIFQWKTMPFGLCSARATFQRPIDIVLSGLNFEICLVYLDDVIIFGQDLKQHLEQLEQVFQRLRVANLKLNPRKCRLLRQRVEFLEHVITTVGLAMDPSKITEDVNGPVPGKLREVRAFLASVSYYRKFVKGFSLLAAPLFALTKRDEFFNGGRLPEGFCTTKRSFDHGTVFNASQRQWRLHTGLRRIRHGDRGCPIADRRRHRKGGGLREPPVVVQDGAKILCYKEKTSGYRLLHKVLQAVLVGVEVLADDRPCSTAMATKSAGTDRTAGPLAGGLAEFDFRIIHRPMARHGNADALSRKHCLQCGKEEEPLIVASITEVKQPPLTELSKSSESMAKTPDRDENLRVVTLVGGIGWKVPRVGGSTF